VLAVRTSSPSPQLWNSSVESPNNRAGLEISRSHHYPPTTIHRAKFNAASFAIVLHQKRPGRTFTFFLETNILRLQTSRLRTLRRRHSCGRSAGIVLA
jgi:hypothetical protein